MSSQSPNFNLVIATTSDQVNVVTQIANNFSTLDTVLSVVLTATGAVKPSTFLAVPTISSPVISGSMTGVFSITASTGNFQTVTATSGSVTLGYLGIGTYSIPATLGADGALLTVQTGNAQWVSPSGGTGANTGLSNLASVAINTNLNSFTASAITMSAVIATSGTLTGLTVFQATTGTFAGNVTISGTATINAVNCTGGAGTFASVGIGTYSLPSTLGSNGQFLRVTTGAAIFSNPVSTAMFCLFNGSASGSSSSVILKSFSVVYDAAGSANGTGYVTPSSGLYNITFGGGYWAGANNTEGALITLNIAGTGYGIQGGLGLGASIPTITIIQTVASGAIITGTAAIIAGTGAWTINGMSLAGYKMLDI